MQTRTSWIDVLGPDDRLNSAAQRIEAMLDLAIELIHLHECNRIIVYSDTLKSQVPRSYAGVAYRVFSKALVQRELAGVCTLWDTVKKDRNSIPTVVALINSPDVRDLVASHMMRRVREGRLMSADEDDAEVLSRLQALSERALKEAVTERLDLLQLTIEEAIRFMSSDLLCAARDYRNAHLSHNLSLDAKLRPDLASKYRDERKNFGANGARS